MNHQDTWESRKTIFLDWSQLNRLLHIRLFELLGRDVLPQAFQDGVYFMSAARPHTKDYTERENPPVQD